MQYFGKGGAASGKAGGGASSYQEIEDDSVLQQQVWDWVDSLEIDEENSVVKYTGGSYYKWNYDLRNDNLENSSFKEYTPQLDAALSKFTLDRNITTYRGIDSDAVSALTGMDISADDPKGAVSVINGSLKGAIISDKGYLSTSVSRQKAYGFSDNYMLRVHTPKGKGHGAYVKSLSQYASEKEFLMPRGSHLKVQKASYDTRMGVCLIDVKYVK